MGEGEGEGDLGGLRGLVIFEVGYDDQQSSLEFIQHDSTAKVGWKSGRRRKKQVKCRSRLE